MRNLRLVSVLPHPRELVLHQAFTPVGDGLTGIQTISNATIREESDLITSVRKSVSLGGTVGVCPAALKIRALFFDMDATVIVEESIVELARLAGREKEVSEVTERAMAGEIEFKEALIQRVSLLRGLPESALAEIGAGLTLNRGIQALVAFCRQLGVKTFMVSGGFLALAEIVSRKVGFDGISANGLEVAEGVLTGRLSGPIVDAKSKEEFLIRTCKRFSFTPGEAAAIGDGANDALMLKAAAVAVGFKPKSVLHPLIHGAINNGDFRFLAPLLFGRDLSIKRAAVPV